MTGQNSLQTHALRLPGVTCIVETFECLRQSYGFVSYSFHVRFSAFSSCILINNFRNTVQIMPECLRGYTISFTESNNSVGKTFQIWQEKRHFENIICFEIIKIFKIYIKISIFLYVTFLLVIGTRNEVRSRKNQCRCCYH